MPYTGRKTVACVGLPATRSRIEERTPVPFVIQSHLCAGGSALADTNGSHRLLHLSRDSRLGQRNDCTLAVQVFDCLVNGAIESGDVSEGLMSQIVRLQVVPDDLDIV